MYFEAAAKAIVEADAILLTRMKKAVDEILHLPPEPSLKTEIGICHLTHLNVRLNERSFHFVIQLGDEPHKLELAFHPKMGSWIVEEPGSLSGSIEAVTSTLNALRNWLTAMLDATQRP